jgi:hypothetical protein
VTPPHGISFTLTPVPVNTEARYECSFRGGIWKDCLSWMQDRDFGCKRSSSRLERASVSRDLFGRLLLPMSHNDPDRSEVV